MTPMASIYGYSSFVVPIAENLQTSHMCIIAQISNFVHWARLQFFLYTWQKQVQQTVYNYFPGIV